MEGTIVDLFKLGAGDFFFLTAEQLTEFNKALDPGYKRSSIVVEKLNRCTQPFAAIPQGHVLTSRYSSSISSKRVYYGYINSAQKPSTADPVCLPYCFTPETKEMPVTLVDKTLLTLKDLNSLGAFVSPLATTGWDPEFFVESGKGELIPAFEFLPMKNNPILDRVKAYSFSTLYADGFAGEFTTPPQTCHGYGIDSIRNGLAAILDSAQNKFKDDKVRLSPKNFFSINPNILKTADDEQVALGCVPSLNAYGLDPINVGDARSLPFRSAGGHIHFGLASSRLPTLKKKGAQNWIKALDRYLAIPCVALFDGIDHPMRRTMYGRAGEYRECKYGFEYRVLSNAWMLTPEIAHLVLNLARGACRIHSILETDLIEMSDEEVQEIINVCDGPKARKYVEDNWKVIETVGKSDMGKDFSYSRKLWVNGLANTIPEWNNVELNWHLNGSNWETHSHNSLCTFGWMANHSRTFDGRKVTL